MARSIETIKQEIANTFLDSEEVRKLYDLSETDTFEGSFSKASLESILFHIVAVCANTVERLVEEHRAYVEQTVLKNVPATIPWYHAKSIAYRDGYELVFDTDSLTYDYSEEAKADTGKAIIRYVAVVDEGYSVSIMVAGEGKDGPQQIGDAQLERFRRYIDRIKPAGVVVSIDSPKADEVMVYATVALNPLMFNTDGSLVIDGSRPVEDAIKAYFRNITYGGQMSHMRLEDAIQSVEGVENVEITSVQVRTVAGGETWNAAPSRYTAAGGSFVPVSLNGTINYEI